MKEASFQAVMGRSKIERNFLYLLVALLMLVGGYITVRVRIVVTADHDQEESA